MPRKSVSLAVGRGEKLPVSKGAGLTAKVEPSTTEPQAATSRLLLLIQRQRLTLDARRVSALAWLELFATPKAQQNEPRQALNAGNVNYEVPTRTT